MNEYEVKLRNGWALVYADCYVELGDLYQFYTGDKVVKQFAFDDVVSVTETWTGGAPKR